VPNLRVQSYNTEVGADPVVAVGFGHTHTAFVVESLIDESEKAGKDPVEGRLAARAGTARNRRAQKGGGNGRLGRCGAGRPQARRGGA
jgi:hypothetical protein